MSAKMYQAMVPPPVSTPHQSQEPTPHPHQQVGMMDEQRLVQDHPASPDESFLASLRRSIECHFNPDSIMQNSVIQAVLVCYQGLFPFQLLLADPNFQMFIAHCIEMKMPVVNTFCRALEHSRIISVTDDQMFIYLVLPSPTPQQPSTPITQVYSGGYHRVANGMGGNTGMTYSNDNVHELASINCQHQVTQNQYMYHPHYHHANSSVSPTSVLEAPLDQQQNGVYVRGGNEIGCDDKHPRAFGAVPTTFVPTTPVVFPRPYPPNTVQFPVTNSAEHPVSTTISSAHSKDSFHKLSGEVAAERQNAGFKYANKKRNKFYVRKKKNRHQPNNTPVDDSNQEPAALSNDGEQGGLEKGIAEFSIDAEDHN